MNARRHTTNPTGGWRRSNSHAAKERPKWNLDPFSKTSHHALLIERNDLRPETRKILRQKTTKWAEGVVGVRQRQLDLLNAHLEGIARLGTLHVDRPSQDMSTWSLVGDFLVDVPKRLLHLIRRHQRLLQSRRAVGNQ